MKLKVPASQVDSNLNNAIKRELLRYIKLNLTDMQCKKWNSYMQDQLNLNSWDVIRFLIYTVNSLKFTLNSDGYIVYLDKEHKLPDTNYSLESIMKLIDYGNIEIKGTHIMDNAFAYVENNIDRILLRMLGY